MKLVKLDMEKYIPLNVLQFTYIKESFLISEFSYEEMAMELDKYKYDEGNDINIKVEYLEDIEDRDTILIPRLNKNPILENLLKTFFDKHGMSYEKEQKEILDYIYGLNEWEKITVTVPKFKKDYILSEVENLEVPKIIVEK